MKRPSVLALAAVAAAALIAVLWIKAPLSASPFLAVGPDVPNAPPGVVPAFAAAAASASTLVAASPPERDASTADRARVVVATWFRGYTSRDPYPLVMELRAARQKGAFAAALELTTTCMAGLIAIGSPRPFVDVDGIDPQGPKRMIARQEIETRCTRFSGVDALDLAQPLPGDEHGARYRQALATIQDMTADRERIAQAVEEVAAQGQLARAADLLSRIAAPQDGRWRDRQQDFYLAVSMARWRVTSAPGMGSNDLRRLIDCYRGGSCSYPSSELSPGIDGVRRDEILRLAGALEAALRDGDAAALLALKP